MENLHNVVKFEDFKEAQRNIKPVAMRTPLIKSNYITTVSKARKVFLKCENMQKTGSFKFRGAYNKLLHLTEAEKEAGVIACSAGNHAQGVALSASIMGIKSTIVMPETAPKAKVEATRGYGAEVIQHGQTFDDAKAKSEEIASQTGQTFVHPYDDRFVIAGQGTIGFEILEDMYDVDTVICPIGGGGIISGVMLAIKALNPRIKVIGVQAENVHGMTESIHKGIICEHFTNMTIADGCAVKTPGNITFDIVNKYVDDIVLVTEEELEEAMKDLIQRNKLIVEGAGALSTAAILSGKVDKYITDQNAVAIISGGNVDLKTVSRVVDQFIA